MMLPQFLLSMTGAAALVAGSIISPRDVQLQPRLSALRARDGSDFIHISELVERGFVKPIHKRTDILEKRANQNRTIDLSYQKTESPLYSGSWPYESPRVPIGPLPLSSQIGASVSLTVQCVDCKTYGTIELSIDDDNVISDLKFFAGMTFHNVGAYVDLSMLVGGQGTYTIGLGYFKNNSKDATGKYFAAKFGASVDLILQVTGEVQATGGLQVAIPDGEQIGLALDFGIDVFEHKIKNARVASIDLIPQTDFYLLPLAISSASVNITAAIRIQVAADLSASLNLPGDAFDVKAGIGAGAQLTVAKAKLGTSFSAEGTCRNAVYADIESNAGLYAQAFFSVGDDDEDIKKLGPSLSTVFFTAGYTKCLASESATRTPAIIATKPATQPVAQIIADGRCPSAVTMNTTTASTYTMTSCIVPEMNCPTNFIKEIVLTNTETVLTTICPGVSGNTATATAKPHVTPVSPSGDKIILTSMSTKQTLSPVHYNITGVANGTRVDAAFVSATPPPTTSTTLLPTGTPSPNDAGSQKPGSGAAGLSPTPLSAMLSGMVAVGLAMLLL